MEGKKHIMPSQETAIHAYLRKSGLDLEPRSDRTWLVCPEVMFPLVLAHPESFESFDLEDHPIAGVRYAQSLASQSECPPNGLRL